MRVLVCDDDPVVRSIIGQLSVDAGHEVVGEAESSHEALELLHHLRPDVVVVDLALRSSSGHPVLEAAAAARVQAIIFSSFIASEVLIAAEGDPVVVEKPDFDGLVRALGRVGSASTSTTPRPGSAGRPGAASATGRAGPGSSRWTAPVRRRPSG